jgi:putative exosortase-associated protein (TIGR04073 family)
MKSRQGFSYLLFVVISCALMSGCKTTDPVRKIGRGTTNIATAPLELVLQPIRMATVDERGSQALTGGVVKGLYYTAMRISSGIWDLMTFPFELPHKNQVNVVPESIFEAFGQARKGKWEYPDWGTYLPHENQEYEESRRKPHLSYPNL